MNTTSLITVRLLRTARSFLTAVVLLVATPQVFAQSALLDFSSSMFSFSADFTQTVYDSDSVALQESVGRVELMRPGRFRWTYTEPTSQVIVADGTTLWVYDEDIKQVTVQPQSTTLGSAPIGLLSGEKTIESEFTVIDLGEKDGLQWFELQPMIQDTDFNAIYIALDDNGLHAMELRDNFDQATQIKFANFKKNVGIDKGRFIFIAPDDADVVGEMGAEEVLDNQGFPAPDLREVGDDEMLQNGTVTSIASPDSDELLQSTDTGMLTPIEPETLETAQPEAAESQTAEPEIVESVPEPETTPETTTVIDGNQLQMQEVRE